MKKVKVLLEPAGDNWAASSPDVPGVVATGDTAEDALRQFGEALEFHLEASAELRQYATNRRIIQEQFPDATKSEADFLMFLAREWHDA